MKSFLKSAVLLQFCLFLSIGASCQSNFDDSVALVIGIGAYRSPSLRSLRYAKGDASAMADYLRKQGFVVTELYDQAATRTRILQEMHNIAVKLDGRKHERVLIFFSGHGHREELGGMSFGSIVPYDGGNDISSQISLDQIKEGSAQMGNAIHQLFIIDACFGGLLTKDTTAPKLDPSTPHYIDELAKRRTRQVLTAGDQDQEVLDEGPNGHSLFVTAILEGLRDGQADIRSDGYITFADLSSYVQRRASNDYQTPVSANLPNGGFGEFLFRSPKRATKKFEQYNPATSGNRKSDTLAMPLQDIAADFSIQRNPNNNWSYGYMNDLQSSFTRSSHRGSGVFNLPQLIGWQGPIVGENNVLFPIILSHISGAAFSYASVIVPVGMVGMHPGPKGEYSVVRWTAPSDGIFIIEGKWKGIEKYPATRSVRILVNGATESEGLIESYGAEIPIALSKSLKLGDTVDFAAGVEGSYIGGISGLQVTIKQR